MKTKIAVGTMMLIAATFAAPAALVNSHGQTSPDTRTHKPAPAPTCCFTAISVKHLPSGGIGVSMKKACVPGCDKPCLASRR
jgi:hypothetical protein